MSKIDVGQKYVVFSPDLQNASNSIDIFDLESKKLIRSILYNYFIHQYALVCEQTEMVYVAVCTPRDTVIQIRDLKEFKVLHRISIDIEWWKWKLSSSGNFLVIGGNHNGNWEQGYVLKLIHTQTKQIVDLYGFNSAPHWIDISKNDQLIAASTSEDIVVWDSNGIGLHRIEKDATFTFTKIVFSNDSTRLIFANNSCLFCYDLQTHNREIFLQSKDNELWFADSVVSISTDDKYLLSPTLANMCLFDFERNRKVRTIKHRNNDAVVQICNDGLRYISILGKNVSKKMFLDVPTMAQTAILLLKKRVSVYLILDCLDFLYANEEKHDFETECTFQRFFKFSLVEKLRKQFSENL